MRKQVRQESGTLLWGLLFRASREVSEEDVAYFREHPDQIEDVSAPIHLHRAFLFVGFLIGIGLVGLSRALTHFDWLAAVHPALEAFLVDVVFEVGAALIGAAIVTYVLVIVLKEQQVSARKWRTELRKRISDKPPPNERGGQT
ncbi:MAG: hypothetical protein AAF253_05050 [Pseudomonadota bacterium]